MYFVAKSPSTMRRELVEGRWEIRYRPWFAFLVFLPVILMAAFGKVRADVYLYMSNYRALPSTVKNGLYLLKGSDRPGFILFELIIKQLSGGSEQAFRLAIALIQALPVIFVFRRYSDNYLFSVYMFIARCVHLSWMMNGIRQFIAVSIIFAATPWIIEKKYLRAVLVILLAATFHRTALFMIPVIFIVQGRVWNWKTIVFSIAVVLAAFLFAQNSGAFEEFADTVGYSVQYVMEHNDNGMNPLRVVISSVPLILSFSVRKRLSTEGNRVISVATNMSVITVGVGLIAVVTSGIMTGRMLIYTSLYNNILLPNVVNMGFRYGKRRNIYVMAFLLYFVYYLFETGVL